MFAACATSWLRSRGNAFPSLSSRVARAGFVSGARFRRRRRRPRRGLPRAAARSRTSSLTGLPMYSLSQTWCWRARKRSGSRSPTKTGPRPVSCWPGPDRSLASTPVTRWHRSSGGGPARHFAARRPHDGRRRRSLGPQYFGSKELVTASERGMHYLSRYPVVLLGFAAFEFASGSRVCDRGGLSVPLGILAAECGVGWSIPARSSSVASRARLSALPRRRNTSLGRGTRACESCHPRSCPSERPLLFTVTLGSEGFQPHPRVLKHVVRLSDRVVAPGWSAARRQSPIVVEPRLALVGGALVLIRDPLALVGSALALVSHPVSWVGATRVLVKRLAQLVQLGSL
jgi:hypothetical protein